MKRLFFFRDYLAEKYGHALYRIPLDPGFSCPHRLNGRGEGGCVFCAADGSRARHLEAGLPLAEQVRRGVEYVRTRYRAQPPYIAYFQAFTATNAEISLLRSRYEEALAEADFRVLIVATRPDCLPEDCLEYLQELSRRYELWVELGVQTASDETLKRIRRGHDFQTVVSAVKRLDQSGIRTAAHLILGLPGESRADYLETARKIAALPFSALKIHNLLVLKGTDLEKLYLSGEFSVMNEYEYAAELGAFLREMPDSMMLMRLSAEAAEDSITAPKWWMKKGQFLEMFLRSFPEREGCSPIGRKKMRESAEEDSPCLWGKTENSSPDDLEEGENQMSGKNPGIQEEPREEGSPSRFAPVQTGDGSYTLYHPLYRQHFHSVAGAREESWRKYIGPCRIREKLESGENISVLEVGFGLGCNLSALSELAQSLARGKVYAESLENDRGVLDAALALPEQSPEQIRFLSSLRETGRWETPHASFEILWGDARESVSSSRSSRFNAVFLDAFTPESNPELWTLDFILALKNRLKEGAFLASYCSAYPFIGALLEAGFHLFESRPFGRRRGGIVASTEANPRLPPLAEKDLKIATLSTAGIPFRDPGLRLSRKEILENRKQEVSLLRSRGVPKWYVPGKKK